MEIKPIPAADFILVAHVLYVSFVVLGVPLVIVGAFLRWSWVHNAWFRFVHLVMILVVAAESLLGVNCPLTVWERALRPGGQYEDSDFIATWLDRLLFYHFPHWVFTAAYVVFGLLVLGLFWAVPVKWPRQVTK